MKPMRTIDLPARITKAISTSKGDFQVAQAAVGKPLLLEA
jgi:hypothetical protein